MATLWISTGAALDVIEATGREPGIAVDQLLNALRSGEVQSRATQLIERSTETVELQATLTDQFWSQAQPLSGRLSPVKLPHWCEWNSRRSSGGWIAVDVVVSDADVRRVWSDEQPGPAKGKGGRKPAERWAEVASVAVLKLYEDGMPATHAELIRVIQENCGDAVADTQVKTFVSDLFKRVQSIGKSDAAE